VSKLYNTLEKIRTGEQGVFSNSKSPLAKGLGSNAKKSGNRRIILLGSAGVLVLVLVVFLVFSQRKDVKPPATSEIRTADSVAQPGATDQFASPVSRTDDSQKLAPTSPALPTASLTGTADDLYRQLNDTGIELVEKNQHWRGIYFFEQARKHQPERVEALINMAVTVAELGLHAPAKRLFSEAHALAPNHPLLRKNLDLLGQADFFDDQWVASLFTGPTLPMQNTKPQ